VNSILMRDGSFCGKTIGIFFFFFQEKNEKDCQMLVENMKHRMSALLWIWLPSEIFSHRLRYLGCVWFLEYGPARPVGCSPRPIGCLDDLLILSRGVQILGSSLHPRKRISPPFLGVQALASARELRGCARELEKLGARVQARRAREP
jgi:hypothetical protein